MGEKNIGFGNVLGSHAVFPAAFPDPSEPLGQHEAQGTVCTIKLRTCVHCLHNQAEKLQTADKESHSRPKHTATIFSPVSYCISNYSHQ